MADIRSPICVVLGHVDHGKTLLLDKIRGTAIQKGESGGITQAIGASIIPVETLQNVCGELLEQLNLKLTIPGLLFIDTPGHEAFTSLRKRGGSLADIAVVVIDINDGFKPQTHETIKILKNTKTPFIIAANKLDLLSGWQPKHGKLMKDINNQYPKIKEKLDMKIYEIVGKLAEYGFDSERFDRVDDYTKKVGIVPVSAMTGMGIPELLMVLTGLSQKYLNQCLECEVEGPASGTILEVKEEKGLGVTADAIIYDGTLNVNDLIVIGGVNKPLTTKVRALLIPKPLEEMRDKKTKFLHVDKIIAATGVKIVAPDLDNVVAGMPLREATSADLEEIQKQVKNEVNDVLIETDQAGIVVKADNLGSLEALINLLGKEDIPIRKASIGQITKKDIMDVHANQETDPLTAIMLAFNIKMNKEAQELAEKLEVPIISDSIIYKLIIDYKEWIKKEKEAKKSAEMADAVNPCKIRLLKGYVFRQSNPAVVGVEVVSGLLTLNQQLMKNTEPLSYVKTIQHEKKNIQEAKAGMQVAISLENVTVGRQINEGDVLFSYVSEKEYRRMKSLKNNLNSVQIGLLKEIAKKMREKDSLWGI
ncbi:MAG: putative translation initiation factor IF-2 [Candidatus Woesearchaeota archaeon]|nr:putative translation initiation factor IF-2 [Candidatus Woesearchaeota archaeon]